YIASRSGPTPRFPASTTTLRRWLFAPRPVRLGHLGDQLLKICRNPRASARSRLPAPQQPEGVAVPPNQRLWPHDHEGLPPLDEPREHDEREPRRVAGATRLHLTFEVQRQLLAQEQILGGQLRARSEADPDEL